MAGVDHLLAKSLSEIVRKKLGDKTVERIEIRLFEKFGISFTQSIEQFEKLDTVLREIFGSGADGLEKQFVENVCTVKKSKSEDMWITISDKGIASNVLAAFGDGDKKAILNTTTSEPKIIYDIIKDSGLPQTSCYRKINALINDGLLIKADHVINKDGKKIAKYLSVFKNVSINIQNNSILIDVQLNSRLDVQSSILHVVYGA